LATVHLYHMHNHPIFVTFANILLRSLENQEIDHNEENAKRRIIANRIRLTVFMTKHSALGLPKWRKHRLPKTEEQLKKEEEEKKKLEEEEQEAAKAKSKGFKSKIVNDDVVDLEQVKADNQLSDEGYTLDNSAQYINLSVNENFGTNGNRQLVNDDKTQSFSFRNAAWPSENNNRKNNFGQNQGWIPVSTNERNNFAPNQSRQPDDKVNSQRFGKDWQPPKGSESDVEDVEDEEFDQRNK